MSKKTAPFIVALAVAAVACSLITNLDDLGASDASDAAITWCSHVDAALCEDFDRSDTLSDAWTTTLAPGSQSQWSINTADYCSPSRSLALKMLAVADAGRFNEALSVSTRVPVGAPRHFIAEADFKMPGNLPLASNSGLEILALSDDSTFGDRVILYRYDVLKVYVTATQLDAGGTAFAADADMPMGKCVRLRLEAVFATADAGGMVALSLIDDGGVTELVAPMPTDVSYNEPVTVGIDLGMSNTARDSPAFAYKVDNVTLNAVP